MSIAVRLVSVGIPTLGAIAKDKDGNDVGIADLSCRGLFAADWFRDRLCRKRGVLYPVAGRTATR